MRIGLKCKNEKCKNEVTLPTRGFGIRRSTRFIRGELPKRPSCFSPLPSFCFCALFQEKFESKGKFESNVPFEQIDGRPIGLFICKEISISAKGPNWAFLMLKNGRIWAVFRIHFVLLHILEDATAKKYKVEVRGFPERTSTLFFERTEFVLQYQN